MGHVLCKYKARRGWSRIPNSRGTWSYLPWLELMECSEPSWPVSLDRPRAQLCCTLIGNWCSGIYTAFTAWRVENCFHWGSKLPAVVALSTEGYGKLLSRGKSTVLGERLGRQAAHAVGPSCPLLTSLLYIVGSQPQRNQSGEKVVVYIGLGCLGRNFSKIL